MAPIAPLAAALAALAAPAGEAAREESAVEIGAGRDEMVAPCQRGTAGDAELGVRLRIFLRPLPDIAPPRALAPFLERASEVDFAVRGGYRDVPASIALPGDLAASAERIEAALSARIYPVRWLALVARTGYGIALSDGGSTHTVPFGGGLFVRLGDFELGLSAEARYRTGPGGDGLAARAAIDLRLVALEHIDLAGGVALGPDEHAGYFRVGWYPSRALGLLWSVYGGRLAAPRPTDVGAPVDSLFVAQAPIEMNDFSHFGFAMGGSYWPSPALGVSLLYSATWFASDPRAALDQRGSIAIATRWR